MTADVPNGFGRIISVPLAWSCEGAAIDASGRLQLPAVGRAVVGVTAAGLKETAMLCAGDTFVEHFDEAQGTLRDGWIQADFGEKSGAWGTPHSGHDWLNSLHQQNAAIKTVLLWQPGRLWADYSVQADLIIPKSKTKRIGKLVHGLVVRAEDKDNHYRLEVERREDGSVARLIRRKGDRKSVV